MTDTNIFYAINGLTGKIPFFDRFFEGISNDYFSIILICLTIVFLWFSTRESSNRERNQRLVILSLAGMGLAEGFVKICTAFYHRPRPFDVLPSDTINLLFYKPHDYSFPSSFTAVVFALALPILFVNKKYGLTLVMLALLSGFGRIYIGVHYPLDVLGGIGFAFAGCLAAWGFTRLFKPLIDYVLKFLQYMHLA